MASEAVNGERPAPLLPPGCLASEVGHLEPWAACGGPTGLLAGPAFRDTPDADPQVRRRVGMMRIDVTSGPRQWDAQRAARLHPHLDLELAQLLLLLTPEGVTYADLLRQWGRPLDMSYSLRLMFAFLIWREVASLGLDCYALRPGPKADAALAEARVLVAANQITAHQARVLLLVSLEGESVTEVADRLAERGHLQTSARVRQLLDELTSVGVLRREGGKGRMGARYRLGGGMVVEVALDRAYALAQG